MGPGIAATCGTAGQGALFVFSRIVNEQAGMNMESSAEQNLQAGAFAPWIGVPLAITFGGLGLVIICGMLWGLAAMAIVGIFLYLAGLIYFLVQTLGRLILKQWSATLRAGFCLGLCLTPGCLVAIFVTAIVSAFQSEDGFAQDLTIPAGLEIAVPLPEPPRGRGDSEDSFQKALLAAWSVAPTSDPCVVPSLPSLRVLASEHRPLLMRYLASSPAWRVFEEDGVLRATRRWRIGHMWLWRMHGYYVSYDVGHWSGGGMATSFHSRTTIGLDGKPWSSSKYGMTWLEEGTSPWPIRLDKRWAFDSHVIVRCDSVVAELFEQSEGPERRITKAAFRELEMEFKALLNARASIRSLLPVDSLHQGTPVLNLYNGSQRGIYEVEVWINPGEAGLVYLKAFEVTRGTQLSAHDLREDSNERTGWSEDSNELFYSNTNVFIYEGDWGDPYAARFELWFVPDSGQGERKMLERVFRIEGWQR